MWGGECVYGGVCVCGTVFNICFEIYIHDQEARTSGGKKYLRNMRTHIMIHIELDGVKVYEFERKKTIKLLNIAGVQSMKCTQIT